MTGLLFLGELFLSNLSKQHQPQKYTVFKNNFFSKQ